MEHSQKENNVCKNLTLCYYNRYLRDRGIITEQEYLRMLHLINAKHPVPSSSK